MSSPSIALHWTLRSSTDSQWEAVRATNNDDLWRKDIGA